MTGINSGDTSETIVLTMPNMPVVMVTAYPDGGKDARAAGYLSKPVKRHEILEVLRTFFPDFVEMDNSRGLK